MTFLRANISSYFCILLALEKITIALKNAFKKIQINDTHFIYLIFIHFFTLTLAEEVREAIWLFLQLRVREYSVRVVWPLIWKKNILCLYDCFEEYGTYMTTYFSKKNHYKGRKLRKLRTVVILSSLRRFFLNIQWVIFVNQKNFVFPHSSNGSTTQSENIVGCYGLIE